MRWMEPTQEQIEGYREWVASRPDNVRAVAEKFEPWSLYRLKSSGHRVTIASFDEGTDNTITLKVAVTGQFNRVVFERLVFGVSPDDLEPCELPLEGEPLGTLIV